MCFLTREVWVAPHTEPGSPPWPVFHKPLRGAGQAQVTPSTYRLLGRLCPLLCLALGTPLTFVSCMMELLLWIKKKKTPLQWSKTDASLLLFLPSNSVCVCVCVCVYSFFREDEPVDISLKSGLQVKVGFPGGSDDRQSTCWCRKPSFDHRVGKISGGGNGNPLRCSY